MSTSVLLQSEEQSHANGRLKRRLCIELCILCQYARVDLVGCKVESSIVGEWKGEGTSEIYTTSLNLQLLKVSL